jgi:hypothetical protein
MTLRELVLQELSIWSASFEPKLWGTIWMRRSRNNAEIIKNISHNDFFINLIGEKKKKFAFQSNWRQMASRSLGVNWRSFLVMIKKTNSFFYFFINTRRPLIRLLTIFKKVISLGYYFETQKIIKKWNCQKISRRKARRRRLYRNRKQEKPLLRLLWFKLLPRQQRR